MPPLTALDRRLFAPMPRCHHQRLVMALAVVLGARLATSPFERLSDLPDAMFDPPWFLSWLPGAPGPLALVGLQVVGLVAAVAVVVTGGRRAVFLAVAWAALLVLAGVETSAGKILHNQVLLLLACIPFLVPAHAPAGAADPGEVAGWHRRTAMVVVALAYALTGYMKLRHAGLAWVTSDNLRWVLYAGARSPRSVLPEVARWVADRAWLATGIAAAAMATELLFPLGLVARRLRLVLAGAVVALHVGVFLALGLDYWSWVAVVVILFVPWLSIGDRRVPPAAPAQAWGTAGKA